MSIGSLVSALAFSEERPDKFVRAALEEPEAVVARTVDIVERIVAAEAAGDEGATEPERLALPILLHICAELGATRLHRPLLKLLACDRQEIDDLLDYMVTESMPDVLISTYDGAPQPLIDLIEDPEADEFCRDAAFRAWTYLAAKEAWPSAEAERWLRAAFDTLEPREDCFVWGSWLNAVATLGLEQLLPLADTVFAENRLGGDPDSSGLSAPPIIRQDFDETLQQRRETDDLDAFLQSQNLHPAKGTIEELSGWYCYSEEYRKEKRRRERGMAMIETVFNENRDIGRNDPCPCGSGRKYKKCCLGGTAEADHGPITPDGLFD